LLAQARRIFGRHLDDLRDALAVMGERLRDAVAHSVGGTVAGTAREVVRGLLASPEQSSFSPTPPRSSSHWGSLHDPERTRYDEDDNSWTRDWPDRQSYEDEPPVAASPVLVAPAPLRWARALAVGCHAVAWWLRRQASNAPAWATLGVGFVVAVAAYWAGATLSGAALSMLALADAPHATSTVAWPSSR
jgi:hypothetical protein